MPHDGVDLVAVCAATRRVLMTQQRSTSPHPANYIPEAPSEGEALTYGRLILRLDPHLRSIVLALIRRLVDDAFRHPQRG